MDILWVQMEKIKNKSFNKVTGNSAEKKVVEFLKNEGYKILETNFSCVVGEIDIICKDKDTIVFVEVKYKNSDYFGLPREAVTPYKQNKIRKVSLVYLRKHDLFDVPIRFDVVDVLQGEITHIKNCF